MNQYLLNEYNHHPKLQPQDVVKFCYQASFGAEHILTDPVRARMYLQEELESVEPRKGQLTESISEKYVRVDLAAWKGMAWNTDQLFEIFAESVKTAEAVESVETAGAVGSARPVSVHEGSRETMFKQRMDDCRITMKSVWNEAEMSRFDAFLAEYYARGIEAVHHSETYRETYDPHYRVVLRSKLEGFLEAASGVSDDTCISID